MRFIFVIIAFTLMIAGSAFYAYGTQSIVTGVVILDKERITSGNDSRYLIFTENETFENTDSFFHLKFNSSDVYGHIQEGDTCIFDVYGWRIPLLSQYRNIITAYCS